MANRPDRPLVVKATLDDRSSKRISFASARNCSYDLLKHKVDQCFSLYSSSYSIEYKDDDGETYYICTDEDLTEAIHYFQAGTDDAPLSSAASILSMRSLVNRKITLRVSVTVEFDGSLSDTSSLRSLDEFRSRNGSGSELSFSAYDIPQAEQEDDSITVSSRDTASLHRPLPKRSSLDFDAISDFSDSNTVSSHDLHSTRSSVNGDPFNPVPPVSRTGPRINEFSTVKSAAERYPDIDQVSLNPADYSNYAGSSRLYDTEDRNAAWLREQNDRALQGTLGALPEPSVSDDSDLSSAQDPGELAVAGDLALERDPRGKYYYTYTGSSLVDDTRSISLESENSAFPPPIRPTSMQIDWIESHQTQPSKSAQKAGSYPSTSQPSSSRSHYSNPVDYQRNIDPDIPSEVLKFLPLAGPPEDQVSACSECGVLLDNIRYVCHICGPRNKSGVGINPFDDAASFRSQSSGGSSGSSSSSPHHSYSMTYPPPGHSSSPAHSSSSQLSADSRHTYGMICPPPGHGSSPVHSNSTQTLIVDHNQNRHKPLPSLPSSTQSLPSIIANGESLKGGYELCSDCIESVGITHAIDAGLSLGMSPSREAKYASSEEAEYALSQWRRSAPRRKGQLRHAYLEKIWGYRGWEDVEQDNKLVMKCSTCNTSAKGKRYKCASCSHFILCKACYSQVHDLHPSHAFLLVPDKPSTRSIQSDAPHMLPNEHQEKSMVHEGIKCAHCQLDIVGPRFHCVICSSIDICDQCESAGLTPLDDADHNSSHILIKIPYPLETSEVQNASQRAMNLWLGRDAAFLGHEHDAGSDYGGSSYAETELGAEHHNELADHGVLCDACHGKVQGVRYQCVNCPSMPFSYNLCTKCEPRSYRVHDPMHAFLKLPRPVHHPIAQAEPILPILYKTPVGPSYPIPQSPSFAPPADPTAYLQEVVHRSAMCDRCMTLIRGAWFRCVFCPKDLCDSCEELDTHDDTHVYLVFKSHVDISVLKQYADLEDPQHQEPMLPHRVYYS